MSSIAFERDKSARAVPARVISAREILEPGR
jgi:hypothetical protein